MLLACYGISEPTLMRGRSSVPALVQQFYPGMKGGEVLAEAILGLSPFSGRLPVTTVVDTSQLPPYLIQQLSFPPGRTHRYLQGDPLFPFGYGMTSRSVTYSNLRVRRNAANITVSVDLAGGLEESKAGDLRQTEVVQVYFGHANAFFFSSFLLFFFSSFLLFFFSSFLLFFFSSFLLFFF
eukprot:SAG31_NODE_713_length_12651_cov_180.009481_1_plen_180_part_10